MTQRCTDPQCPSARIPNHAHMTQAEQDALVGLVVQAMTEDLPSDCPCADGIATDRCSPRGCTPADRARLASENTQAS